MKMNKLSNIISEVERELDYLNDNYDGVHLQPLYDLISSLSELLDDTLSGIDVTTPFSDDLGNEDEYQYPRELGEVEDTFNVEINQGNGNPITLTRRVVRSSQDDGSYLQSMIDVLSKLTLGDNDK
jgi:hypothetical protein